MKRILILIIFFSVFIVIFVGFWLVKGQLGWLNKNMETTKICFNKAELSSGEHCFIAEVAKTQAIRTRGLMFRESLALDAAMLFVFEQPGVYNFWMKNCKIPLDIIWLDGNYRVVAIKPNNQPCPTTGDCPSIIPTSALSEATAGETGVVAKYVLEINAGLASQIGLVEGSYFTFQTL